MTDLAAVRVLLQRCGQSPARWFLVRRSPLALSLTLLVPSCQIIAPSQLAATPSKRRIQDRSKTMSTIAEQVFDSPHGLSAHVLKRGNQAEKSYQSVDRRNTAAGVKLIHALLDRAPSASTLAQSSLQTDVLRLQGKTTRFFAISEKQEQCEGLPLTVLREPAAGMRRDATGWWILQAPHRFHDLHTAQIAAELFFDPEGSRAVALMVNSRHRYAQSQGKREKRANNPSDAAHNGQHPFNAFTQVLLQQYPRATFLQLHGFSDKNPKLPAGKKVDAILSSGNPNASSPRVQALAQELKKHFGPNIYTYPESIGTLGGTTNVQGQLLSRYGPDRFIHLEMGAPLRKQLRKDPSSRRLFLEALNRTLTD